MKLTKFIQFEFTVLPVMFLFFGALALFTSVPVFAATGDAGGPCKHLEDQFHAASGGQKLFTDPHDLETAFPKYCTAAAVVNKGITIIFGLSGGASVLFIVIGGAMYMTSAGNQEQAEKGRKTLIYAIGGLVIIVLASAIVKVVVSLLVS